MQKMLNENSSLLSLGHSSFFSECMASKARETQTMLGVRNQALRLKFITCTTYTNSMHLLWWMLKDVQNDPKWIHDLLNRSWPSGTNGIQTHTGASQSILSQSKNRILKISRMNVLRQDRFPGSVMPLFPSALFNAFLPRLRGSCGWWWGESLNHCEQSATDNQDMNVDNSKALWLCFPRLGFTPLPFYSSYPVFHGISELYFDGFIVCQPGAFASNRNSPFSWVAGLGFPCGRLRSEENRSKTSKVIRKSDEKSMEQWWKGKNRFFKT